MMPKDAENNPLPNLRTTIFVALLDEGIDVWRPVVAEIVESDTFRIVSKNPDPEDEHWQFPSGSLVHCERKHLDGREGLVAVSLVEVRSNKE